MIFRIVFAVLVIAIFTNNAVAGFVVVSDKNEKYDLTEYIEYYKDDSGALSLEDIQSLPDTEWKQSKYTQFGFYKGRLWMRIRIDFSDSQKEWFIGEKISTFDIFDFYNPSNGVYIKEELGLFVDRSFLFKNRSILIKPGHQVGMNTYYASVKTGTPMLFIFTLLDRSSLNEQTFNDTLFLGVYYGAALLCLMFHLFIYFSLSTKDRIYLYYCLFVVSIASLGFYLLGLREKYFGPPWTVNDLGFEFEEPATTFIIFFGTATFSWFVLAYHQLRLHRYPWIERVFIGLMVIITIAFIPLLFARTSLLMSVVSSLKAIFNGSIPFIAIYIYRKEKYLPALYFALSATFTDIGFGIYFLTILGHIKGTMFTAYSFMFMSIPEYTLLAFSLASRINAMRNEHDSKLNQNILELIDAKNIADRANQLKDEFLATSSHELKSPLNAIYGYMQILKETKLDVVQENCVGGGIDQVEQLNKLVNDLLDYSRIEKGQLSYDIYPALPAEIVVSTVESLVKKASKSVEVSARIIDKDNVSKIAVGIDPVRFRQLTVNLINNAIKFTERGLVSVYLYCASSPDGSIQYVLEVKDTGIGISKDQLDLIFEKFHQVSHGTYRQSEGIGLGLAIVKSIAELFSGKIDVQSIPNVGSTFIFSFKAPIYEEHYAKNLNQLVPPPRNKEIKILLVEDHHHNRTVFQYLVSTLGVDLDIAENVDEAIKLYTETTYSGIFIDLNLSGKDGFELARFIRSEMNDASMPLIAVSADTKPSTKSKCKKIGFNGFVDKPIKRFVLHSKIKEIVASHDAVNDILNKITI